MTSPRRTGGDPPPTPHRSRGPILTPLLPSSFVGRERELAEIGDLLDGTRLLTLTGSGGCGKTRLALAAVDRISGLFGDDVGWVWLGPVSEEDLAYEAVASAVGARETPGLTPVEAVVEHLGDPGVAEELFSSGYVDNNPSNPGMGGPGNVKRSVADWRRAFPDTMNRFGDVLDGGDLVAVCWATRGTHRREFLGFPATGWRIEMTSGGVFRVEGGKVAESWDLFDALGLLRRLGTKPRPEGGR